MWSAYGRVQFMKEPDVRIFPKFFRFTSDEVRDITFRSRQGAPIFNPDRKRIQYDLDRNSTLFAKIKTRLKTQNLLKNHQIGGIVFLQSKPGCKQQYWHTDYDPDLLYDCSMKPYGSVIALENGTKFETPTHTYHLNKGDFLMFSGDTVHAGASYEKENTRIHVYLDVPNIRRQKNRTWFPKSM